jgi:nucleoside-diphosphate-sugar epimerase
MGGTGFVGSHVVNALIDQNVKVTILPREAATSHVKLKQVIVDHAMRGDEFDGVIGASWAHTGRMDYRNNIENHKWAESTINSYEVLSGLGIPFVGLGTCLEKLDYPTDEYTKAKILVSDYFKAMESKYDWTWLRLHYLYSKNPPRPRLIEEASTVYTKGGVMILKNPEARHDYIEITEATKLIACAVFGRHFGIRDIGSGHLKSNAELLNEIYPTLRIESGENIETLSGYQGLADIEYLK